MNFTILTMSGISFQVDEATKNLIVKAGAANKSVHIFPNGEVLPLKPFPLITLTDRAVAADNDKLHRTGKFRCRFGTIHDIQERCECSSAIKAGDEFKPLLQMSKMPAEIREKYEAMMAKMKMPATTYADQLEARAAGGDSRAKRIMSASK